MRIRTICPYSFGANTYLLISGNHALVVDPSVSVDALSAALSEEGAVLEGILLTHGHFDHTTSVDTVRDAYKIPAYIHEHDSVMLLDSKKSAFYTFFRKECVHRPAEHMLNDGDVIKLGDESITVIHTPGHSGGSVCFLCGNILVSGDTLFADSIGRTDLWSGDSASIYSSLKHLEKLDGKITIYPGHGLPSKLDTALQNAAFYF